MKKILKIMTCMLLAASAFVGCEKNIPKASNSNITSASVQEPNETTAQKVIEPPEEGWTIELLVDTVTFFDKELSYPITLEQLGKDFSINTNDVLIHDNKIGVELYYKDEFVCSVVYIGLSSVDEIKADTPIAMMSIRSSNLNEQFTNCFEINSVTFGTEWNDVTKLLGSPTDGADKEDNPNSLWEYRLNNDGDYYLYIGISKDKVASFSLGEF